MNINTNIFKFKENKNEKAEFVFKKNNDSKQVVPLAKQNLIQNPKILFKAKAVFPFDLFPDEIIVEEKKVDIAFGYFIMSQEVFTIPIKNINYARSMTNLLFGTLMIEVSGFNQNPSPIKYLWAHDAIKARRIINGLVQAERDDDITISSNHKNKLHDAEELGKTQQSSHRM